MIRIAIIDTIGLCYDGDTLNRRGLGGSESAVILMSKELVNLGFEVTVFNDCSSDDCIPGEYDGVEYTSLKNLKHDFRFDVAIAMRSVAPFVPADLHWQLKNNESFPDFSKLQEHAKHKVLWMHDTFCDGDHLIEEGVNRGFIDEIFALSDFHTSYILNCDHGVKRNFEVLKNKVFQTRNGIGMKPDFVDISKKDPDLFVYNSSVTKGMVPLVEEIWPKIKSQLPNAKLKIVGGYYKFRDDSEPDEQQKKFQELCDSYDGKDDIVFTGIITQKEISDILTEASYLLYPAAFPETFGISTLEALAHNVPVVTCQFGALEETAIDAASYKIRYAIEPNSLFPNISKPYQVDEFVNMTVSAYTNKYLHQQKMHACNKIKNVCGWDTVALQWKQHFYKELDYYLPVEEYRKVVVINHRIQEVYGRRFGNVEDLVRPSVGLFNTIKIVTPVYNAENYIAKCIRSVAAQDYYNWEMIIIDDCSTDNTYNEIVNTIGELPPKLQSMFKVIKNTENIGAVGNQIEAINKHVGNDIVMLLDGDDWLVNDPTIFTKYNNIYNDGAEFTYGSCWSLADNIPLQAQEYPPLVKETGTFRDHKFNWNMPYTHLRTFRGSLMHAHLHDLGYHAFKDQNGNWLKAGGDTSIFYSMIEYVDPSKIVCVPDITCVYNDTNPINDYKVNGEEQNMTATNVINSTNRKKKILIAIPTAKYIESETFKSIHNMDVPEGYETEFQYFYGYQIDQIRNLIANWAVNYDYLFSVDSDISFEKDTLTRLLAADKDIVSGIYRQRLDNDCIEIYDYDYRRMKYEEIYCVEGPVEIGACGMGCVLIRSEVFRRVEYPHFAYKSALTHEETFSEDVYFCKKAKAIGFEVWCLPTLKCDHHGSRIFKIDDIVQKSVPTVPAAPLDNVQKRLQQLHDQPLLPQDHVDFLYRLKTEYHGIVQEPKVIYDIGACVLHWTNRAHEVWPKAKIVLFEAMSEVDFLYTDYDHYLGVLGNRDYGDVKFNQNLDHPGGNSYYKENPELSPGAKAIFTPENVVIKPIRTLDSIVKEKKFALPDMIKMDVQGAELDILRGATETLKHANCVILEVQHMDYNIGAPKVDEVCKFMSDNGFDILAKSFSKSVLGVDSDYCFYRP